MVVSADLGLRSAVAASSSIVLAISASTPPAHGAGREAATSMRIAVSTRENDREHFIRSGHAPKNR